jgi:hypothetical protein
MLITTFEHFRYLPQNRGKDPKTVYKEWLFEEAKLLMMVDGYMMAFAMQSGPFSMGVVGPGQSTAGGSGGYVPPIPPPPLPKVTYYTPDGNLIPGIGYYEPDEEFLFQSYYVFVNQ